MGRIISNLIITERLLARQLFVNRIHGETSDRRHQNGIAAPPYLPHGHHYNRSFSRHHHAVAPDTVSLSISLARLYSQDFWVGRARVQ